MLKALLHKTIIWIWLTSFSLHAFADCPGEYSAIQRLLLQSYHTMLTPIPERHLKAVLDAAEKQLQNMTKGMSDAQKGRFFKRFSEYEVENLNGAGGEVKGLKVKFDPIGLKAPLSLLAVIHEAQHLADNIVVPRALLNPKSKTKVKETRAFLRQQAFFKDVYGKIGHEGTVDLAMSAGVFQEHERTEISKLIEVLIDLGPGQAKVPFRVGRLATEEMQSSLKLLKARTEELTRISVAYLAGVNRSQSIVAVNLGHKGYADQIARELAETEQKVKNFNGQLPSLDKETEFYREQLAAVERIRRLLLGVVVTGIAAATYQYLKEHP